MTPAQESREKLVAEHRRLRRLANEVDECARAVIAGTQVPDLALRVRALAVAVYEHNESERKLLAPILIEVAALGNLLVSHLEASHNGEHAAIERAMDLATSNRLSPRESARVVLGATRDLLSHMEDEERQLMTDAILTDSYSTDGFCS